MVAQFCELYPQHRTAVSAGPVTVGALDQVCNQGNFRRHMLTTSVTACDPIRTSQPPLRASTCQSADHTFSPQRGHGLPLEPRYARVRAFIYPFPEIHAPLLRPCIR